MNFYFFLAILALSKVTAYPQNIDCNLNVIAGKGAEGENLMSTKLPIMQKVPLTNDQVLQPITTTAGATYSVSLSGWTGQGLLHATGGSFPDCIIAPANDDSTCTGNNAICYLPSFPESGVSWMVPAQAGNYTVSGVYGLYSRLQRYSVTAVVMVAPPTIPTSAPTSPPTITTSAPTSPPTTSSSSSVSLMSFRSFIALVIVVFFYRF